MYTSSFGANYKVEAIEFQGNWIDHSTIFDFQAPVHGDQLIVRMVLTGAEHYLINRQSFVVNAGEYLITNREFHGQIYAQSKKLTTGICIAIHSDLIREAVASRIQAQDLSIDLRLGTYFFSDQFIESKFQAMNTQVGTLMLRNLSLFQNLKEAETYIKNELIYQLTDSLIADQISFLKCIHNLPANKWSTKSEIMRKLMISKDYIHTHFAEIENISDVAKVACMSEFHFYRMFKFAFGHSPYQYILYQRLESSKKLILQGQKNISEIALISGFSDIFTFSKVFKKYYGIAPSYYTN